MMRNRIYVLVALLGAWLSLPCVGTRTAVLKGSTYAERARSLVGLMLQTDLDGADNIKYQSPFYFARLWCGHNVEEAVAGLEGLYRHQLRNKEAFYESGSDMDFFAHATMHGYMLTKDMMPYELRSLIKEFMQLGKYAGRRGTLNMRMMSKTSGFLCAEEWPDFVDGDGHGSEYLRKCLREEILKELRGFFLDNCREADAFTYIGTNMQYVRMLAEFCGDDEIRSVAAAVYRHMAAQMLLPWNQGLYCANPPRSKGWANLLTGNRGNVQISQLAWLFYGSPDQRAVSLSAKKDNFGCFNFWMAYQRNVGPLPYLESLNSEKEYPYDFHALRIDERHYACRYTYQSLNYGLSSQTIEAFPDEYRDFQYTYAFKETKNIHLVWKSDVSDASVFSVCVDNPERPQRYQSKSNKPGYGENPYHRVFGYGGSAVGVYNVADDYMDKPDFYRMYVPFSRKGILKRRVREINGLRWVLCHTGSMMFAFAVPEEWTFDAADEKFAIKDHDIMTLRDRRRRRGSWVLETTEIIGKYKDKNGNLDMELDRFAVDLASKVSFSCSADYETGAAPSVSYRNLHGDVLQLTFFPPDAPYEGQYVLNGVAQPLNIEYISKSRYMEQRAKDTKVLFHTKSGLETLRLE